MGTCAQGFGSCCAIYVSDCSSDNFQFNLTYIVNPGKIYIEYFNPILHVPHFKDTLPHTAKQLLASIHFQSSVLMFAESDWILLMPLLLPLPHQEHVLLTILLGPK